MHWNQQQTWQGESVLKAKYNKLHDRYDTIIIKSTLLRKPLHYLIWWGNIDMCWSWWRVISINLNSPSLLYVHLLNLPFCIWMYSANISEVWNQMLLKNPIYFELMLPSVCSFIKCGFSCLNSQYTWEFLKFRNEICCRNLKPDLFLAHAFLLYIEHCSILQNGR